MRPPSERAEIVSPKVRLSTQDLEVFFEERHFVLATDLAQMAMGWPADHGPEAARKRARELGEKGLYAFLVPQSSGGFPVGNASSTTYVDVRAICLVREMLGQIDTLADSIFAVQGLGSYPIVLAGSGPQRSLLPSFVSGQAIGAFALTEPCAGSDVASIATIARKEGSEFVLDGEKVFISNAGLASHYVVFANANPSLGRKGITAFVVESGTPGLMVESIATSTEHPLGRLRFDGCRVPDSALLGEIGSGFRIAMQTLDTFRVTVGAAAAGMARRAFEEARAHVRVRTQFGRPLIDQQLVKAHLADMATELDAARLLVLRAAFLNDTGQGPFTKEAAMAKLFATEAASRIIDTAVQLLGGSGVVSGGIVEKLYREIRPLRIYEGTSEIQRLVIASSLASPDNAKK